MKLNLLGEIEKDEILPNQQPKLKKCKTFQVIKNKHDRGLLIYFHENIPDKVVKEGGILNNIKIILAKF